MSSKCEISWGPAKSLRQDEWKEEDFEDLLFVRSGGDPGVGSTAMETSREKTMVAIRARGSVLCSFNGHNGLVFDAERSWIRGCLIQCSSALRINERTYSCSGNEFSRGDGGPKRYGYGCEREELSASRESMLAVVSRRCQIHWAISGRPAPGLLRGLCKLNGQGGGAIGGATAGLVDYEEDFRKGSAVEDVYMAVYRAIGRVRGSIGQRGLPAAALGALDVRSAPH